GVLRPLLGVDELRQIPGLLVGQAIGLAQRHVVLDEGCQGVYPADPRSPVVGVVAPSRRKHYLATDAQTRPLITMADRALSCIGLLAALVVGLFGRLVEPR